MCRTSPAYFRKRLVPVTPWALQVSPTPGLQAGSPLDLDVTLGKVFITGWGGGVVRWSGAVEWGGVAGADGSSGTCAHSPADNNSSASTNTALFSLRDSGAASRSKAANVIGQPLIAQRLPVQTVSLAADNRKLPLGSKQGACAGPA